ncbi:MAG: dephospho-CoA kinase [Betaproteobacteria bacterium]
MLLVGLTGGIASGKSLVAHLLRDLGAQLIDADRIVHELLVPNQLAWREVIDHFGKDILLPDGCIDRRKLGEIIFNDEQERAWLNRCLHPKVFDAYMAQIRSMRNWPPDTIIVLDAALLIETGYHTKMDRLIVVYANVEQQIERLTMRENFTKEQALARLRSQMPLSEKRGYADYVIDNTGSREHTERQTREVFMKLKQEAERSS